ELLAEETEARRQKAARAAARDHDVVFEIEELRAGALAGVTIKAEKGEIIGIAGLAGSGRDTVLGACFGSLPRASGEGKLAGGPPPRPPPEVRIRPGGG